MLLNMSETVVANSSRKREIGNNWGEFVGAIRYISNSNQEMFAKALGVQSAAVRRWEQGGVPQARIQLKLSEMFDLTEHEVIALRGGVLGEHDPEVYKTFSENERDQLFGAFVTRIANGPPLSDIEGQILRSLT